MHTNIANPLSQQTWEVFVGVASWQIFEAALRNHNQQLFLCHTWQVASVPAGTCRRLCSHAWLLLRGLMWRRVCQAARLICARVAGGTGVSVLMEGALCLAISEMINETKYWNPTLYSALLFSVLWTTQQIVLEINFSITKMGRRRTEEKQKQPNLGQEKAKFNACSAACFSSSSKLDEKN